MNSDTPLDYALFQLSPRRSRCELFVSGGGKTEKLASGLLKPFVAHLKVAEEQVAQAVQLIKLEVERRKNSATWFNKGTLERFVRFVSTPEVLELVNTFEAEMSQLEGARRIYSQGVEDPLLEASGGNEKATTSTIDVTKKELVKAIDVRLLALKQDLTMACGRASAAGFTLDNISELLLFADRFGAYRLNEACTKFISLCQRRPELLTDHHRTPPPQQQKQPSWKEDQDHGSSSSSDMSIDDPDETAAKPASWSHQPPASKPASQSQAPPHQNSQVSEPSREKKSGGENGDPSQAVTQPAVGGTRRLSVQDRINLFESKQKEQSGGGTAAAAGINSGIGNKIGGKVEFRKLSSDVSLEKTVLRRWSGASDMSIDLNTSNNSFTSRKEVESTGTTPSSSFSSQVPTNSARNEEKDTAASRPWSGSADRPSSSSSSSSSLLQLQSGSFSKDKDQTDVPALKDQGAFVTESNLVSLTKLVGEGTDQRSQISFENQFRTFLDVAENLELNDQAAGQSHFRETSSKVNAGEKVAFQEKEDSKAPQQQASAFPNKERTFASGGSELAIPSVRTTVSGSSEIRELKNQPAPLSQFKTSKTEAEETKSSEKGLFKSQRQFKTFSGKAEATEVKSGQLSSESCRKTFSSKLQVVNKGQLVSTQVQSGSSLPKQQIEEYLVTTGLDHLEMRLQRPTSSPDQTRKFQGKKDEKQQANAPPVSMGRKAKGSEEAFDEVSKSSIEPIQITKPSKGNQELNNELQMKADELEKLFAAHKLRVPGDGTASTPRGKPTDMQTDKLFKAVEKKPAALFPNRAHVRSPTKDVIGEGVEVDADILMKMVDNEKYNYRSMQKLADLSLLEDVRGKYYEKYMQKRDAKLREEWGSKRTQKEAKMKAMQDSLEHNMAEMKAKFAGSADKMDSAQFAYRRAEKLRIYSARAIKKNKEQQPVEFQKNEEEDEAQESFEHKEYGQDRFLSETHVSDSSLKSSHSKQLLSSRSVSSVAPRTSALPIPKASTRQTNSVPVRRRMQPENLLAQSVPNFSDFRTENSKSSSGTSKTTGRTQPRNYTRSRSISEDINIAKEDKPHRSQSMRKSSVSPAELQDPSTIDPDNSSLPPIESPKEQTEHNQRQKIICSKPFLRKGYGVNPGSGAGNAKLKSPMVSENLINEEESKQLASQMEDSLDMVNGDPSMVNENDDEFEVISTGEVSRTDNENPRFSVDSVHSADQGSENGDILGSFSQRQDSMGAVLSATTSKFKNSITAMQESPGESPTSWNSHIHRSFSYVQEASDFDASVDSPVGSPPSWNSNPLNQMMESDAARMRKKWGNAEKPILVANPTHQSRKDVTKGFKRLLKFGRKSKGADCLINDWVSASTNSEGDDDTEDGRDPANRMSDDMRKSRMGFPQYQSAYDGFNDGDIFHDEVQSFCSSIPSAPANFKAREEHLSGSSLKATRSFFSLSTFRSKGSESKLR